MIIDITCIETWVRRKKWSGDNRSNSLHIRLRISNGTRPNLLPQQPMAVKCDLFSGKEVNYPQVNCREISAFLEKKRNTTMHDINDVPAIIYSRSIACWNKALTCSYHQLLCPGTPLEIWVPPSSQVLILQVWQKYNTEKEKEKL